MLNEKKFWTGSVPAACQTCHGDFKGAMFDASVGGRWGNICSKCFIKYDCKLGVGKGQAYAQQADGRWLKVGG